MIRHAAALAALLLCSSVFAEDTPQKLDTVVVTATRSPQPQNRLPAALTVITRAELDASGARTLAEALRGTAGLQLEDFYGDGSQYATVDMRGFGLAGNANTLILVDGRRLNNADSAPPDLSSIALADVERIEIVQGSAGSLYGDQAVGGVINIITRQPGALAIGVNGGVGSYDERHAGLHLGEQRGTFFYRFSDDWRASDNYRRNNVHENNSFLGRAGYDYGSGSAYLELGQVRDRFALPGALSAADNEADPRRCQPGHCDDFNNSRTGLQRLYWEQALFSDWSLEFDATRRIGHADVFIGLPARQDRRQWSFSPRVSGKFPMPAGAALLTAGVDVQTTEYQLVSPFGTQKDDQHTRAAFAQLVLPLVSTLEATVGGRVARADNRLFDGFTFPTPTRLHDTQDAGEAGLAWKPYESLRVYARYDRNFRFAKADEYFTVGPTPGASPLLAQSGATSELGADWKRGAVSTHAELFHLDLRHEISFNPLSFANFNLDRTRRDGLLLQTDWQTLDVLKLAVGGQYLRARFSDGPFEGNEVPTVARLTGRVAATLRLPRDLSTYLEIVGTGPRYFDGDFANAQGKLAGMAVTNLALNGTWSRCHAGARVNNLLDRRYSEYGALDFTGAPNFYPSPGRNFWLDLGWSL